MFIKPANIRASHVRAFFTTRQCNGADERVDEAVAREFHISRDQIYLPVQQHTDSVHVLGPELAPVVSDAVVTDRKHIFVGVLVADCVPILLYDAERGVVGAVHAGWRGTANRILKKAVDVMRDRFSCEPGHIQVAIGPSIRKCSYEVGEEVTTGVRGATGDGDYHIKIKDRHFLDLSSANKIQALSTGITEDNIWQSGDCTFCKPGKYYSYRYSGGGTGRQGGFIGMW